MLFIIHVEDSAFTTAKIGIYTLHDLSPCSEIEMTGSYIINMYMSMGNAMGEYGRCIYLVYPPIVFPIDLHDYNVFPYLI